MITLVTLKGTLRLIVEVNDAINQEQRAKIREDVTAWIGGDSPVLVMSRAEFATITIVEVQSE